MTQLKAAIVGYGKMGKTIENLLVERGHSVAAKVDLGDDFDAVRRASVAFEFTQPDSAPANILRLLDLGVPTICGTTGWDTSEAKGKANRTGIPLLIGSNFSLGAALVMGLTRDASRRLSSSPEFDIAVFECHHRAKRDAPSGTARTLAQIIESVTGTAPSVAALRIGEHPGEHRVLIEGPDESIEIIHSARSRRIFAFGAVKAAEWLLASGRKGWVPFNTFWEEATR